MPSDTHSLPAQLDTDPPLPTRPVRFANRLTQLPGQGLALSRRIGRNMLSNLHFLLIFLLLVALIFFYFFRSIVIIVGPGEAGVLYRLFLGGTVTNYVYPEGIHFIFPWDRMYIYNARIQTIRHEFTVLTNKGLPIHLKIAVRYRPEYEMIGVLHQQVGPDYVHQIVVQQIESVLRKDIGQQDPEDIYTNKEGVLTGIIVAAIEEAGRKFVYVEDVIIREVALPTDVRDAIDDKLVQQQREQAYQFILNRERQEAERKRIEAAGIRDYQETIAETLTPELLRWQGVQATENISTSENSKVVIIGAGEEGLPVILGNQ